MTDDDRHPLAAARGILLGVTLGALIWVTALTLGALIYLACWQAMP